MDEHFAEACRRRRACVRIGVAWRGVPRRSFFVETHIPSLTSPGSTTTSVRSVPGARPSRDSGSWIPAMNRDSGHSHLNQVLPPAPVAPSSHPDISTSTWKVPVYMGLIPGKRGCFTADPNEMRRDVAQFYTNVKRDEHRARIRRRSSYCSAGTRAGDVEAGRETSTRLEGSRRNRTWPWFTDMA
ncbi:hypothetical protein BV20DRAFT_372041 [Pilatotrama ljubarskyi]|nr:hypothetical protein BV20DRAFT_372041 [Pilatotrama ljubarskyi]